MGAGNSTTFTGPDIKLQWQESSLNYSPEFGSETQGADEGARDVIFKDYEVRFYDTPESEGGTLLRTFHTLDNFFNLTFAKNKDLPGGPYRTITAQVYQRGRQNQLSSTAAVLTVTNPPPAVPTIVRQQAGFRQVILAIGPVSDADFSGVRVWGTTTTGFTPADGNLLYDGRSEDGIAIGGLSPNTTYYFRMAAFDLFGKTGLLTSAEFSITTLQAGTTDISDGAVTADKITANSITADKYNEIRNTILLSINDSLDASNPLVIDFPIVSELVSIVGVTLSYKVLNFRAYATTATSGGASTSGSGGAETPTSSDVNSGTHIHSFPIIQKTSGTAVLWNLGSNRIEVASSSFGLDIESDTVDGHLHNFDYTTSGSGSALLMDSNGNIGISGVSKLGITELSDDHQHSIPFNATGGTTDAIVFQSVGGGKAKLAADLSTLGLSNPSYLNVSTSPSKHTHTVTTTNHTHTTPNHTHGLDYGIQEDSQSPTITVKASNDGTTFGSAVINSASDQLEVDIASEFSGSGWKALKFETDANARINGVLELKLDITA